MLRRGISERSPSVCAFCRHRLSLRRTQLPSTRLISSTRSLRDNGSSIPGRQPSSSATSPLGGPKGSGWGQPSFASGPAATNAHLASGGLPNNGAFPTSKPPPSTLLPHEIEARQRMAARRAEEERTSAEREVANRPKPGEGFRYTWNAKKQTEIKEFVRNEARPQRTFSWNKSSGSLVQVAKDPFMKEPESLASTGYSTPPVYKGSDRGLADPFRKEPESLTGRGYSTPPEFKPSPPQSRLQDRGPPPFSRNRPPPRALPLQAVGSSRFASPKLSIQKESPRQTQKPLQHEEIQPPQLTGLLGSNAFGELKYDDLLLDQDSTSRSRNTRAPVARKREADFRPNMTPSGEPSGGASGSWGSLARRQQPNTGSADFWSMVDKKTAPTPKASQPAPHEDWGKEFDKPQQRRQTSPKTFDNSRYQPGRGRRQENVSGDWNAIQPRRQARETPTETTQIPSTPSIVPEAKGFEERKSRRSESDRSARFEIERESDRKVGKKRGGRGSKYVAADEGEGMDDAYEDYQDRRKKKAERRAQKEAERTEPIAISLPELISISNLASALKVEKTLFLDQLAELGFEGISLDSIMAGETAALVAQEYGYEPTVETGQEQDLKARPPPEDPSVLPPRPPVVTIMGHVDHGKTTLLDFLRKSSVAAGEHGGITQHIGAFSVSMSSGKQITFLDTPGHAAFLSMRQRGANVTDIVVLVVAADDSVKPQTIEAIKHARTSKVPIIVAINKIDKEGAQIERVKSDLATNGVEIEDYGGDVQVVCVSGKTGQGMEDLEENILTLSEILDMRAETDGPAEGWILESSLKPIGKVATILVKRGTLRPGDFIVAGTTYAKIRHLRNEAGQEITEAPPGTPVEILGWRDLPAAGDEVIQGPDERRVRLAAEYREGLREREQDAAAHEKISEQRRILSEQRRAEKSAEEGKYKRPDGSWGTQEQASDIENGTKMVNFVVKGDVHGSVEAVCAAIAEIGSNEVQPRVLVSAPGAITESDVEHAATSNSTIVNFNLPISGMIKRQAETAGVKIMDHAVIYHLTDDVKDHLSTFLSVDVTFKVLAEAEVLQIFPINIKGRKYKNIAGCRIRNGTVERNQLFRVTRAGEKIFEGKLESLKHGKKDIDEARKGGECGIGFEFFQDLEVGDQIQAVEEVQTKRSL